MALVEASRGPAMNEVFGLVDPRVLDEVASTLESVSADQREVRDRVKALHGAIVSLCAGDVDFDRSDPAQVDAFLADAYIVSARHDLGLAIYLTVQVDRLLLKVRRAVSYAEAMTVRGLDGVAGREGSR
ncbi:hypothetical protein AB0H20_21965 [Nocardia fluminea]|uniref:hypothetical protein n=1 Tax=Nocardia fluminea TaxID=134984 RepID=UPI0033F03077